MSCTRRQFAASHSLLSARQNVEKKNKIEKPRKKYNGKECGHWRQCRRHFMMKNAIQNLISADGRNEWHIQSIRRARVSIGRKRNQFRGLNNSSLDRPRHMIDLRECTTKVSRLNSNRMAVNEKNETEKMKPIPFDHSLVWNLLQSKCRIHANYSIEFVRISKMSNHCCRQREVTSGALRTQSSRAIDEQKKEKKRKGKKLVLGCDSLLL